MSTALDSYVIELGEAKRRAMEAESREPPDLFAMSGQSRAARIAAACLLSCGVALIVAAVVLGLLPGVGTWLPSAAIGG